MSKPQPLLWLSDSRGQYIPRDFAKSFSDRAKDVSGVSDEQWATLEAGPDEEWYWDCWNEVCDSAVVTDDKKNVKYRVHQDGDCWLIPTGMEWDEENEFFAWPEELALKEKHWFSSSSGFVEIEMTLEQAQSCSHSGQCDDDVEALSKEPVIAAQLAAIDPEKLRRELKEYGAWDAEELADHDQNLQRILWLAAGDIADQNV